jgi:hypothetical protein
LGVLDYSQQLGFGEAIGSGPEGHPDGNNVEAVCHG